MMQRKAALKRAVMVGKSYGPKLFGTFLLYSSLVAFILFNCLATKTSSFSIDAFDSINLMFAAISYYVVLIPSIFATLLFTALVVAALSFRFLQSIGIQEGALIGAASGAFVGVFFGDVSFVAMCAAASLASGIICGWRIPVHVRS